MRPSCPQKYEIIGMLKEWRHDARREPSRADKLMFANQRRCWKKVTPSQARPV